MLSVSSPKQFSNTMLALLKGTRGANESHLQVVCQKRAGCIIRVAAEQAAPGAAVQLDLHDIGHDHSAARCEHGSKCPNQWRCVRKSDFFLATGARCLTEPDYSLPCRALTLL